MSVDFKSSSDFAKLTFYFRFGYLSREKRTFFIIVDDGTCTMVIESFEIPTLVRS